MENKKYKERNKKILSKFATVLENIIYFAVLIPLVISTLIIVFQQINNPDKVPDVFGWKLFMIVDENMESNIEKGDLVFTKNVDTNELKIGDTVAFMNDTNTVKIHKITDISEEKTEKIFIVQAQEDIEKDEIQIRSSRIEGIVKSRIPYIGSILIFIQQPASILIIIGFILVFGAICLYIAKKLDQKDYEKQTNDNKKNN